jgi:hypothetical protein
MQLFNYSTIYAEAKQASKQSWKLELELEFTTLYN